VPPKRNDVQGSEVGAGFEVSISTTMRASKAKREEKGTEKQCDQIERNFAVFGAFFCLWAHLLMKNIAHMIWAHF
jgi:hypothetical protein